MVASYKFIQKLWNLHKKITEKIKIDVGIAGEEKKLDKFIEETSLFSAEQRVGWVCGLGHGVLKTTPEDNVRTFVKKIRESFA